jgi:hypothetical protein
MHLKGWNFIFKSSSLRKRNLANNTGRGTEGPKLTMGVRNFILLKSQIRKKGKLVRKTQVFHFLFSVYFLFAIIQLSNQIKYLEV